MNTRSMNVRTIDLGNLGLEVGHWRQSEDRTLLYKSLLKQRLVEAV
ncbi:MAG: hypothetical protein TR69_WS6001000716 [candidate division WS6 bacterium OLB20]|uniref:Uncharacterized protein n=1 Tax=candidate division WS6 bacterium OLB20 TaxID=1617426 RepID=A0A136LYI4_9BACT|nr:MAG: hypothetical protein TR69_WS6001000716 [candidate division WS6 bacterium OLB20]